MLFLLLGLSCGFYATASSCPNIVAPVMLGEGYNPHVGIDLIGNGLVVFQTNLIDHTVIRAVFYSSETQTYTAPAIISNEYAHSIQLTFSWFRGLSVAMAAWNQDGHIVARHKPSQLNDGNWADIVTVSGPNSDFPDVATNSIDQSFLAYRSEDAYGVKTVEFSQTSGSPDIWTAPIVLATDPTIELPRVAANTAGEVFVIWIQDGQLWGRVRQSFVWQAPVLLSECGYGDIQSHRALVGLGGGFVSLYSQNNQSFSTYWTPSHPVWTCVPVGTGSAITVNMALSTGASTIFGVKGLGQINANTGSAESGQWSLSQTTLNTSDAGGEPDVDASDWGGSWSIWGAINDYSSTQVRFFNGTELCDIVSLAQGTSSGPQVAMNNLIFADPAHPLRPQAHFVWTAKEILPDSQGV